MRHFSSALRFGLAAAALALLPITEATAQNFYNPESTSRVCNIPAGNGASVLITAGPITVRNPTGKFPVTETCPSGVGSCLRWEYRWKYTGLNPSLSLVSAGSNVTVVQAEGASPILPVNGTTRPTTLNTSINFGNVGGEVGMLFTANGDTYDASFLTDTAPIPGTVTAGFKSGNRNGFCAIAGATKPSSGNPDLSTPQFLITNTLGCTATWKQAADGCVTGLTVTGPPELQCRAIDAKGSGKPNLENLHIASTTASCGTEINAPGSTNVCRYNTLLRTYSCVTIN